MKTVKFTRIKVRKSWGQTNPVTKTVDSRKVYSRKVKHIRAWDDFDWD
jgi:hypothetical protein